MKKYLIGTLLALGVVGMSADGPRLQVQSTLEQPTFTITIICDTTLGTLLYITKGSDTNMAISAILNGCQKVTQ